MQDVNALENTQQGQPQGAGQPTAGAAPDGQVEPGGGRQEAAIGSHGRGGPSPEFARRRIEEKLNNRMESLESSVSQLVQALTNPREPQAASSGPTQPDFWSNPEAYMAQREIKLRQEFDERLALTRAAARVDVEAGIATDYMKSEAGYDPDIEREIKEIGVANGYNLIAREKPMLAAELAVRDWRAWKDQSNAKSAVPVNGDGGQKPSRAMTAAVNGSATAGAARQWTPEEIAKVRENGTYAKHRSEILAAVKSRLF